MPDGGIATTVSIETVARDSDGRVYSETKPLPPSEDQEPQKASTSAYKFEPSNVATYYVLDPPASAYSTWDSKNKKARLYQYPEEVHGQVKGCWAESQGRIQVRGPEAEDFHPIPVSPSSKATSKVWMRGGTGARRQILETTENLGAKTIGGFTVQGIRTTSEPLPGERPDGLFVGTSEFWESNDLNLNLSEASTGLQNGNHPGKYTKTKELIDLKLGEPDRSLFQPPQDYEVVTEQLHQVQCGP